MPLFEPEPDIKTYQNCTATAGKNGVLMVPDVPDHQLSNPWVFATVDLHKMMTIIDYSMSYCPQIKKRSKGDYKGQRDILSKKDNKGPNRDQYGQKAKK